MTLLTKLQGGGRVTFVDGAIVLVNYINNKGSGYGPVGRVVASDSKGLRFESSHRQNTSHSIEKTKKEKGGWNGSNEKNNNLGYPENKKSQTYESVSP